MLGYYGLDDKTTAGGYLTTYPGSTTQNIASQCANACMSRGDRNFFGTVQNSTSQGDCYCGIKITSPSQQTVDNCVPCNGQNIGQCGRAGMAIALYARAF